MLKRILVVGGKSCAVLVLSLTMAVFFCGACRATVPAETYRALQSRLVRDGYSPRVVALAFRSVPAPMFHLVCSTMRTGRGTPNYSHFVAPSEIAAARRFIADHRNCFREEKAEYGVNPEIIAALFLVETHFGSFTGKTPTLPVFASFAIMDSKANRDRVWWSISPQDRATWGRGAFDKKLLDRSAWAYRELCALFELQRTRGMRVASLKGSYMGAIGWPQFLPTSLVKYGVDGNGDRRVDLNNCEDAIFSTANYLRAYGWCEARTRAQKEAVIYNYNHSTLYVQIVMAIADRTAGHRL
ncbi:MAG: lytic murein transglycosylase [Syntrophobacteraceae bacterium]|nr:lytic murein transglycosylase [Syntrophobacteraceae bacterium]